MKQEKNIYYVLKKKKEKLQKKRKTSKSLQCLQAFCFSSESVIALAELLKMKEIGQYPGDPVKTEDTQIRSVSVDVLSITDIKAMV